MMRGSLAGRLLACGLLGGCGIYSGFGSPPPPAAAVDPAPETKAAFAALIGGSQTRRAALRQVDIAAIEPQHAGAYMDARQSKLDSLAELGAEIVRHQHAIIVRMPATGLFRSRSADLADAAGPFIETLAGILLQDRQTYIDIIGHQAAGGSGAYALSLSQRQAQAVGKALVEHGIAAERLVVRGVGARYPLSAPDAPAHRIEIGLQPVV